MPKRKKNPQHEVRELILYAENTQELYNQYQSIVKNLKRKAKRGIYDPVLAAKLWKYWIDEAVKRYNKEILGGSYSLRQSVFTMVDRKQAAKEVEAQEREDILAQTNPKRRKKVARKKRRSAKQIAATKKMRAGLKRWKAGKKKRKTSTRKKRKTSTRRKVHRTKRKNPIRKKSGRAIGAASSRLWVIFACRGKVIKFLTFTLTDLRPIWTTHKGEASLTKTKERARKLATNAPKPGTGTWSVGAAPESATTAQIQAACSKA